MQNACFLPYSEYNLRDKKNSLTYECQTVAPHLGFDQQKKEEASLLGRIVHLVHLRDTRVSRGWCCPPDVLQKRERNTVTSGSEKNWGGSGKLPEILEKLKVSFMAHMWS